MTAHTIDSRDFVNDSVAFIAQHAREAIAARGVFTLSLCGGNTPKPVYAALANIGLDWTKIRITFGDERCVPPDHPDSNFRMARLALLEPAGVPERNILRMAGERPPELAATDYEKALRTWQPNGEPFPHDLVLLGMGDDGHTASLFPNTHALDECTRMVAANFVPKFDSWRLTLTFPCLNAARAVCFLVNDPKKRALVNAILAGGTGFPAERVRPASGDPTWILGG